MKTNVWQVIQLIITVTAIVLVVLKSAEAESAIKPLPLECPEALSERLE